MYFYIQTPPINNSNKLPHLLEHCAHNVDNLDYDEYFDRCMIKSQTFYWYTKFDIWNHDINDFIKSIESPFSSDIVKKEKNALDLELQENIFTKKLKKIVETELCLKEKNHFSVWNLVDYHKRYYNFDHYVIADENYNIVKCWLTIVEYGDRKFNLIKKVSKKISNEMNYIVILKYDHWKDQILMHFIEVLIDSWFEYNDRYLNWIYYYPCSCMIEGNWYISLSIPHYNLCIPKNFFERTKEFYIKLLSIWDTRENVIINLLYLNQLADKYEIRDFIMNLCYENVLDILA